MLYLPHSLNGSVYHKHSDQLVDCLCILVEIIIVFCSLPAHFQNAHIFQNLQMVRYRRSGQRCFFCNIIYPESTRIKSIRLICDQLDMQSALLIDPIRFLPECDNRLLIERPVSNRKELLELLFEDQRIDTDEFEKLDTTQLLRIAPLYHCTNLKLLNAWIRKKMYDRFHVFCQITDRL